MFVSLISNYQIKKLIRFSKIYGFSRAYVKAMGRIRKTPIIVLPLAFGKKQANVGVVGCGQFAFATIGYFLKKKLGKFVFGVYDIDSDNANSFIRYYGGKVFEDSEKLTVSNNVEYVYIASNHSTHTEYAIKALDAGKTVYLEKPISVTKEQFARLMDSYVPDKLFVGYNRPFSPAVSTIRKYMDFRPKEPITLGCFVVGHQLPLDHWYRNPEEGTRVCGNIGHWIDLAIHLMNFRGLPSELHVQTVLSNEEEVDDNLSISISSDYGDLVNIVLTSRYEPFEGINETINFQQGNLTAKIDDFRRLTIWKGAKLVKKRYFRKDVGHKRAIYQPFEKENRRDFNEVVHSTRLMLEIKDALLINKMKLKYKIEA